MAGTCERRNLLLDLAQSAILDAVRDHRPPEDAVAALLQGWMSAGVHPDATELTFTTRGPVESLGFVVHDDTGPAGGLILRLPGEFPDSFEAVDATDGSLESVRRGFFATDEQTISPPQTTVRVLGPLRIDCDDRPVPVPVGRPAHALMLVALHGGRVHSEVLVDALWPETDTVVGSTRLRNVLARLRRTAGDLLVRDGEAITFAPGVRVDVEEFEAATRDALRRTGATADEQRSAAEQALHLVRGEVLEEARYEAWAASFRDRIRHDVLALHDLLGQLAARSDQLEIALDHAERAIVIEPYDEHRYIEIARWLHLAGRTGAARRILTRGRAAWAELDLDPTPAFCAVECELAATAPPSDTAA